MGGLCRQAKVHFNFRLEMLISSVFIFDNSEIHNYKYFFELGISAILQSG